MKLCFSQCATCGHESKESCLIALQYLTLVVAAQGPAKKWEDALLSLGVEGSEAGIEGEEIAPLAMENVATP